MKPRPDCPGCGGRTLVKGLELKGQPTVLNYRFRTVAEARKVPRGDVTLRQCGGCGLVFNGTFEGARIPYDERYENRQGASPSFRAHVDAPREQRTAVADELHDCLARVLVGFILEGTQRGRR